MTTHAISQNFPGRLRSRLHRGRGSTLNRCSRAVAALLVAVVVFGGMKATPAHAVSASPRISVADVIVGESVGNAVVAVTLSDTSASTVTVHYVTQDSTAKSPNSGTDYTSASGTLTFAPGETE